MKALLVLASMLAAQTAHATPSAMICENQRREYAVNFDEVSQTLYADDTLYRVLAVEKTAEKFVVVGLTVNDGPTFRAHFRPYKKMEFFSDSQLIQTDGCR